MRKIYLPRFLKSIFILFFLCISIISNATTYYLTNAGKNSANLPASWNTNPAGGGTAATNFNTANDIFIIPSGIAGIFASKSSAAFGTNVTLQVDGNFTIGSGSNNATTTLTVNGTIIFTNSTSTQAILPTGGNPNTTTTFNLGATGTLKTTNVNGVTGTNCSISLETGKAEVNLSGTANYEFNGTATQATLGMPATVNTLTINNSVGVNLTAAVTVTALNIGNAVSNSVLNDNGKQITSSGTLNLVSGTFNVGSGSAATSFPAFNPATTNISAGTTVNYNSSSPQTIAAVNYANLSNTGNGNRILASSGVVGISGTFSAGSGSYTTTSSTVSFNGTTAQTIPAFAFNNLNINNTAGISSIGGNITVANSLALINGVLTTGANKVTVTNGSASRTNGWVAGNLEQKITSTGAVVFHIGDATSYRPVTINFSSLTTQGLITASVTQADGTHPAIGSSGLSSALTVKRYWNIVSGGAAGTYSATFGFVAADIPGGATINNFVIRNYNGSSWSATTTGTKTGTSTQATGLTTFGIFSIGETVGPPVVNPQPANAAICEGSNASFTSGNSSSLTTTVKWQRSVDNGATWVDITGATDGNKYTNFTTNTLNISAPTASMSGYKYQSVYTNINGSGISNTVSLTVTQQPTVTVLDYPGSPYANIVNTYQPVTLNGTNLYTGGTFSPVTNLDINTTTGAIRPSTSAVGTYTVTYTVAAAGGCNLVNKTTTVTITAAPTATISYSGNPFCVNTPGATAVTITGTGNYSGGNYTSSSPNLTLDGATGTITPGTSAAGTYTVTYHIPASGGFPASTSDVQVIISAIPTATINYAGGPFCTSDETSNPVTLTGTGAYTGGSFTGPGLVIDPVTGAITPKGSTGGTHTVTYTIPASGGCASVQVTTTVDITIKPSASLSYPTPICQATTAAAPNLSGTSGGTYSSTPSGLSINAGTGVINASTSQPGDYDVFYTIPANGPCGVVQITTPVSIVTSPTATIAYINQPYCNAGATKTVDLQGTGNFSGGNFSAPSGLTLAGTTGVITPSSSTPGMYVVTYTTPNCPVQATADVEITAAPSATISYQTSPFCASEGTAQTVTLNGDAGGVFSSVQSGLSIDANSGAITPANSSPGTYTINYTFAASGTCPAVTKTTSITIVDPPTAAISYAGSPFCTSTSTPQPVTRTGTNAFTGGTYSSSTGLTINQTTGAITPNSSTPGTYTVTYVTPTTGICAPFTTTTSVTITALPTVSLSYSGPFCVSETNGQPPTLTGSGAYQGGIYSANSTNLNIDVSGIIYPSLSQPGSYTVTYTTPASNGCGTVEGTATVVISPLPTAIIGGSVVVCQNGSSPVITFTGATGTAPYTFTYNINGGANTTITAISGNSVTVNAPTGSSGSFDYNIISVTDGQGCSQMQTGLVTITVTPQPAITTQPSTAPQTICLNGSFTPLSVVATGAGLTYQWYKNTTNSNTGGTSLGSANGAQTDTYTPQATTSGTLYYYVIVSGTCPPPATSAVSGLVTVNPVVTVDAIADKTVCNDGTVNAINFTSPAAGPGTITYSWTNDKTSINLAASGNLNMIPAFTASNSGTAPVTANITVTPTYTLNGVACPGTPLPFTITVNPTPVVKTPSISYQAVCNNGLTTRVTFSTTATGGTTTYNWTLKRPGSPDSTGTGNLEAFTAKNSGTAPINAFVEVRASFTNGGVACQGQANYSNFIFNPTATVTAISIQPVCDQQLTTVPAFSSPTTGGNITYSWTNDKTSIGLAASGNGNIGSFTAVNTGTSPVTATITVTPTYTNSSSPMKTCTGSPSTFTITVNANSTISLSSPVGTDAQNACINSPITDITYSIGGGGTGASITAGALPAGVTGTFASGVFTIKGTPTVSGTFNYTITTSGPCGNATKTGSIVVSPLPVAGTIAVTSSSNSGNPTLLCGITSTNPSNSATITISNAQGTVTWEQSVNGGASWTSVSGTQTSLTVSNLSQTTLIRASVISGACNSPVYTNFIPLQVIPGLAPTNEKATPPIICLGQSSVLTADTGYPPVGIAASDGDFNNGASDNKTWTVRNGNTIDGNALNAGGDNGNPTYWRESNGKKYLDYDSRQGKYAITHGVFNTSLESPVFNMLGQTSGNITFIQSYHLEAGDSAVIEMSTNGGTTYGAVPNLAKYVGPADLGPHDGFASTTLDLSKYLGLSNLRFRFHFYSKNTTSTWALDNLSTPNANLPISYMWSGTILSATTGVPVTATPQMTGDNFYDLSSTVGGCPGGSVTVKVVVNPNPTVGTVNQLAPICSGGTATFNLTGLLPGTTSNIVYNIGGGTPVTVNNIVSDATGKGSFTAVVTSADNGKTLTITSITGQNANGINCGITPNIMTTVTVNPLPTATIGGTTALCQNDPSPTITLTGASATAPYTFTYSINGVTQTPVTTSSGNSMTVAVPTTTAGTFAYALINVKEGSATACTNSQTGTATVTVNPKATIATAPANTLACPEGAISFSVVASSTPAPTYTWEMSIDNGTTWNPVSGADYTGKNTATLNVLNITSGNTKNGYMFRTNVVASAACPVTVPGALLRIKNIWYGYTDTDWNVATNWSDSTVPSQASCDSVIILNVANKPILSGGAFGAVNHLVMKPGAKLTVTGNTMQIAGSIINDNMSIDATAGKIDLNGDKELYQPAQARLIQTIAGKMFYTPYLNNSGRLMDLQISSPNNATVAPPSVVDTLNITGTLSFGNVNNVTLNTGDNITLVSNALGTARVADITNNSTNTGNAFNGQLVVERFLNIGTGAGQHNKSWQFMAIPTQGQTVKQSWMEGGATPVGYGTIVTSGVGSGFDIASGFPSMKTYLPGASPGDPSSPDYIGITNTGNEIYIKSGYMVFIRGDRSVTSAFAPPTATTLRTKGTLLTYNVNAPLDPYVYSSIGNPYASAIDMRKVISESSASAREYYQLWKAAVYGAFGYGSYVAYNIDPPTGDYIGTPGGQVNNNVQSGQAFFVQNLGLPGNIVFNEQSKTDGSSIEFFTPITAKGAVNSLRTDIYAIGADGNRVLADGTFHQFNEAFSDEVDAGDARKLLNSGYNFYVVQKGTKLIIEQRHLISKEDTIFFNMKGMVKQDYYFEFRANGLSSMVETAFLEDQYQKTKAPIGLDGSTKVKFTINGDAASSAIDRFRIVFEPVSKLGYTYLDLKGFRIKKDVKLQWKVDNRYKMKRYDLEKSLDGVHFTPLKVLNPLIDGTPQNWIDQNAPYGKNYYRIKYEDQNGSVKYSEVAQVEIPVKAPSIAIYPNPIVDGVINLNLVNQPAGKYGLRILNSLGQVIYAKQITRMDGDSIEKISWDYNIAHGMYKLEVTKPDGSQKIIHVVY